MSEPGKNMRGAATVSVAAIILGAGRSSRMGAHKLLLPLNGKPLLAWSLAAACGSRARPVIVALGRAADEVTAALPAGPYQVVVNSHFAEGMGTTLALAVGHVPPDAAGALVLLGDQPFMPTAAIEAVLSAAQAQPERIAMGALGKRRGHPVYLPRRVFAEVQALRTDEGARAIIAREVEDITLVSLDNLADELALLDVDTLEDYHRAQTLAQRLAQSSENTPS
ncbi:MAG TPA: nucleotidyltransferase family protein [Ktedonobacterales bacterium]